MQLCCSTQEKHLYHFKIPNFEVNRPGIFNEAVNMAVDKADLIILMDCKKVARGFGFLFVNIDTL